MRSVSKVSEFAAATLTVLRAIDKLDRLGVEGVRHLLGKGRKDESGDFTKGAELDEQQIETLENFTSSSNEIAVRRRRLMQHQPTI